MPAIAPVTQQHNDTEQNHVSVAQTLLWHACSLATVAEALAKPNALESLIHVIQGLVKGRYVQSLIYHRSGYPP